MRASLNIDVLLDNLRKSALIDETSLDAHLARMSLPDDPAQALEGLVAAGLLTRFHVRHLLEGKHTGFFLGPYKLLRLLARGGMGMVYLAEHTSLRRQVALKICLVDELGKGGLERFYREGRAAAALDHPNIVRIHDIGQEGDTHFLIMEYVEGKSLEELLRERGRFPFREAVGLILQAASGLAHAHERGLIHRDIKPANLLLDGKGTLRLLDLGLARFFDNQDDWLTERLGGAPVLGSPDYIAPEQTLGQLDIRSDVYSLGATLYALISGQPPFPAKTASQKLIAHQLHTVRPLHLVGPSTPLELSASVSRMLAKRPDERFQTPVEVIEALSPWGPTKPASSGAGEPCSGPAAGLPVSSAAPWRGLRVALVVGAICLAATAVGIGGRWLSAAVSHRPSVPTPAPATR